MYENSEDQLEFQKIAETWISIIRHIGLNDRLENSSVLDLTSAYDKVLKNMLMKKLKQNLPKNTTGMISPVLSPMLIKILRDIYKRWEDSEITVFANDVEVMAATPKL